MYLFRDLLKTPAHVSSQKVLTHAGTVSKHINLTALRGSEKLVGEEKDLIGLPVDHAAHSLGLAWQNRALQ